MTWDPKLREEGAGRREDLEGEWREVRQKKEKKNVAKQGGNSFAAITGEVHCHHLRRLEANSKILMKKGSFWLEYKDNKKFH